MYREVTHMMIYGNMKIEISVQSDFSECPNDIYGNWTQARHHEGGTTIKDPNTGLHWINANYTPAQLSREYAAMGKPNPPYEAYKSLQDELLSDLYGHMIIIVATVYIAGIELAFDSISTPDSDQYPADIEQTVREYFDLGRLRQEARQAACSLANRLVVGC